MRAVGNTALDPTGVVGFGCEFWFACAVSGTGLGAGNGRFDGSSGDERVVMRRARDSAAAEAGADFEAFCSGDGEHGVREFRFQFIEYRFPNSNRAVANYASHRAADTILLISIMGDFLRHAIRGFLIGAADGLVGVYFRSRDAGEEV